MDCIVDEYMTVDEIQQLLAEDEILLVLLFYDGMKNARAYRPKHFNQSVEDGKININYQRVVLVVH